MSVNAPYIRLKRQVTASGLLDRQPLYYIYKFAFTFGLFALAISILLESRQPWVVAFDAALWGFVSVQMGLLGHDALHQGVFSGHRANVIAGAILGNLFMGISYRWWTVSHNLHHATSNRLGVDFDISYPMLVMDEQQIPLKAREGVGPVALWVMERQHYLAWPVLMLASVAVRLHSATFLRERREAVRRVEIGLLAIHWGVFVTFALLTQGPALGVAFILAHEAVLGLYLGHITATNHWGIRLVDETPVPEFMRLQVATSRNVTGGPLVDLVCGGLNRQIEHHLFPTMPRNNLRKARPMVMAACREQGLQYREMTVRQCFSEMFVWLRRVAFAVREQRSALRAHAIRGPQQAPDGAGVTPASVAGTGCS